MNTVRFFYQNDQHYSGYKCSEPNDQSGEYVKLEHVLHLLDQLEDLATLCDDLKMKAEGLACKIRGY